MGLYPGITKVVGGTSQCDHQPVVGNFTYTGVDDLPRRIDPFHFRDMDMHVSGMLEHPSKREGNAGRLQPGRGDLVHERLELVVVVTIDQINFVAGIVQEAGNAQPRETGADDDDTYPGTGNLCHKNENSFRGAKVG